MKWGISMGEFRLWSRNFIFVCLSSFLYFGSFYLLLPVLPQYVSSLGGTVSQIGLVMGAFTMASVVIRPYFGKLADYYGRKTFMLLGAGLFAFLFLGYGLVETVIPLYVLRIIHGIAHGTYLAAAFAYVADLAPVQRRGEVMGVYGISNVISMSLFPAVGSAIITYTHDFFILFVMAGITGSAAFLAILFIDEGKPQGHTGRSSLMAIARHRMVLLASLTLFTAATAYGAIITFLPVYAPERGLTNFGVFFTAYAAFTLISRVAAGKLSDRFGRRKVIIPFMMLIALAMFLLPMLEELYLLILIGCCFGLGFGAFMPALNAFVIDETSPQERSSALAFFTSAMDVGITTGAVALGLIGEYWGYASMFIIGGVIVVCGIVLFYQFAKGSPLAEQI